MPKISVLEELETVIRSAAREADARAANAQIAEQLYESHAKVIAPFIAEWVIEKLGSLVGKHRADIRMENAPQMILFDLSLGIKGFPRTLHWEGKRIPRQQATVSAFRGVVDKLRDRESPALQRARIALSLMEKYSKTKKRITWGEVMEIEAKKLRNE